MHVVIQASQGKFLARVRLAVKAGFSDQAHLVREFNRVYGMTPERFRSLVGLRGLQTGGYAVLPVDLNANGRESMPSEHVANLQYRPAT
jgi:AraC-like DNA-binding protein